MFAVLVNKWRKHHRIIAPMFNVNLVDQFFPVFIEKTKILVRNLKKELYKTEPFDLWDYIANTTLDTICRKRVSSRRCNLVTLIIMIAFYRKRHGLQSRHSVEQKVGVCSRFIQVSCPLSIDDYFNRNINPPVLSFAGHLN